MKKNHWIPKLLRDLALLEIEQALREARPALVREGVAWKTTNPTTVVIVSTREGWS